MGNCCRASDSPDESTPILHTGNPPHRRNTIEGGDHAPGTRYRALYDFQAQKEGDLDLRKGDIITLIRKLSNLWLEGELPDGRRGIFPYNYVEVISAEPAVPAPAVSLPTPPVVKARQVQALYSYTAQNTDELSFNAGDIINVVLSNSDGGDHANINAWWWKGELNGRIGMFPVNYVQEISTACSDTITTATAAPPRQTGRPLPRPTARPRGPPNTKPPMPTRATKPQRSNTARNDTMATSPTRPAAPIGGDLFAGGMPKLRSRPGNVNIYGQQTNTANDSTAAEPPAAASANENQYHEPTAGADEAVLYTVVAEYDFQAMAEGDLTFRAGEHIDVYKDSGEWWEGTLNGIRGMFPANYVRKI